MLRKASIINITWFNRDFSFWFRRQYWPDADVLADGSPPTPEPLYIDPVSETQSNGGVHHSSASPSANGSARDVPLVAPGAGRSKRGEKTFGDIRVLHVKEKRFSEYVVRELQVRTFPSSRFCSLVELLTKITELD